MASSHAALSSGFALRYAYSQIATAAAAPESQHKLTSLIVRVSGDSIRNGLDVADPMHGEQQLHRRAMTPAKLDRVITAQRSLILPKISHWIVLIAWESSFEITAFGTT